MNKNKTDRLETKLFITGIILFSLSLVIAIQGYFEVLDYIPHIEKDGCMVCTMYCISIPCGLAESLCFAVAAIRYYFTGKKRAFFLTPYAYILSVIPSLLFDFVFIAERGFVADEEYNILVYLITDVIILLNGVIFVQFVSGRLNSAVACVSASVFMLSSLLYLSSVFVFYGSFLQTNFMGYYFCSNISNIVVAVIVIQMLGVFYPVHRKE